MDRIGELVEREAILEVLYSYCYYVDANKVHDVVALFTEDCVFDWGHARAARGHSGIAELMSALNVWSATSHHLSNVLISFGNDRTAAASSYVYAWHQVRATGQEQRLWGRYEDSLVRGPDGWRIRERRLRAAGESGFPPPDGLPSNFERFGRGGEPALG